MKLTPLLEGYTFDGFEKNYPQKDRYWSEFEKEFYGPRPKLPLKPIVPAVAHREPKQSHNYKLDDRSFVKCVYNCPHGLKPLIAVDDSNKDLKVFLIVNGQAVPLNSVIKNGKENYKVWEHARNIFTDINQDGAAGYRHNVRQKATYILNDERKATKCVIYTVSGVVAKILSKYGFNF
jgi:hypothetical protein